MGLEPIRDALEAIGLPRGDRFDLPTSPLSFPDGCQYRIEASGIETLDEMKALLDHARRRDAVIHRVIAMAQGTARLPMSDLKELSQLAYDGGVEVIVTPGPRSTWDTGRHASADWGGQSGWRLRGMDNIVHYVADMQRCVEAGLRGFLLFGEDALSVVHRLRDGVTLPKDIIFKVSYSAGHANPAGARLLEQLGADSFNPVTDLELPMLAALRQATRLPLDLVMVAGDNPMTCLNRFWQAGEIVRVAAPCYLKLEVTGDPLGKVKFAETLQDLIARTTEGLVCSGPSPKDLRIPMT